MRFSPDHSKRMALLWKHQARQCRLEVQLAKAEANGWKRAHEEASARIEEARVEIAALRRKVEALTDNVLFGSGHAPLFHPDAPRFRARDLAAQKAEVAKPVRSLTPMEWRRRAEELDRQACERDQKVIMAAELKRLAEERARQDGRLD